MVSCLQALLRVEGLVRGGAAGLEGFLEMLKPLRQPLTVQLNDRSSVILHLPHSAAAAAAAAAAVLHNNALHCCKCKAVL